MTTFDTALSGLRAADTEIRVTGNNIANVSTTGFKRSRAEFGDVYNGVRPGGTGKPGDGVQVKRIAQQFAQGNLNRTNNNLDLAISGSGFFVLDNNGTKVYTRAGDFGLDDEGFLRASSGGRLQGFVTDREGNPTTGILTDISIDKRDLAPKQTNNMSLVFNLDGRQKSPNAEFTTGADFPPFDKDKASTYNHVTSQTVYDSLGNPHTISQYFVKQTETTLPGPPPTPDPNNSGKENSWDLYVFIDGEQVTNTKDDNGDPIPVASQPTTSTGAPGFQLEFDTNGVMQNNGIFQIDNWVPKDPNTNPMTANGAVSTGLTLDLSQGSQFGKDFGVTGVTQDDYPPGSLSSVSFSDEGVLYAKYNNGQSIAISQVMLADFANVQGLTPVGNTAWAESIDSGSPVVGKPSTGSLGDLTSSALEGANVEISEQLVKLIIAQRNYQASAKTIESANAITETIMNLR